MLLKMNTEELERFITERLSDILETLKAKGRIYTGDINRFSNFNRASAVLEVEPEQALVGFMTKHIVWLLDYVKSLQSFTTPSDKEEQVKQIATTQCIEVAFVVNKNRIQQHLISKLEKEVIF